MIVLTKPEKPAQLDDLNSLFQLMWTDALNLLTDLTEGLGAFNHAAQLHYLTGFLLLLIDSVFAATGQITTSNIASVLAGVATLAIAAYTFYTGWGLRNRYNRMVDRYPGMLAAATVFKKDEQGTGA